MPLLVIYMLDFAGLDDPINNVMFFFNAIHSFQKYYFDNLGYLMVELPGAEGKAGIHVRRPLPDLLRVEDDLRLSPVRRD